MPKKASKKSPENAGGKGGDMALLASGSNGYTAKDIYVLEGLEPVRKHPGMYIGSTGVEGLHHLIWEVVDNSLDEAMAGFAKNILVTLLANGGVGGVRVVDDGRGIPVDIHKQTKKSALETVMTTLHAGGKFGGESYKVSGGLHGVGVSVVNALSKKLVAEVCRDGKMWRQEYEQGVPTTKVKEIGKCHGSGTAVTFEPDPAIFKEVRFEWNTVLNHLRQQAYLTAGVNIQIRDEREKEKHLHKSYAFCFESGIRSYVEYLNRGQKAKHESIFYVAKEANGINVEVALQYVDDLSAREEAFANNIYNPEGGAHITGFRTALTRVLNDYARKNSYLKEKDSLTGEDVREGLTAVISVKLREPQFEGQTKAKLGTPEARGAVESVFGEAFSSFLEENPSETRAILEKVILALEARKAAKAAKETVLRRGALEGLMLPGKLADCQSRKAEDSELFIVEGDSAGGCFSGDTKVALADGRNLSFPELVKEAEAGKKNYCYTILENGSVGIEEIKDPRLTKRSAEVLKITLDNGEEIVATPDHRFMLRNGGYKEAKDLIPHDSLMPLYRERNVLDGAAYNAVRIETRDKSLLHYDTILDRFFGGDKGQFETAVKNFNHKIVKIEKVQEKIDVYDLEVPGRHNFALASGVFVHNSAKQGRDRRFQAILPLRGKILNVERARLDKMLASKEVKALIIALGAAIADELNISKLRYHKIVIMTDADVDGAHIRTLLLTLFYRYYMPMIEQGYLYIAQPPLYQIKKGKEVLYAYSDEEKNKLFKEGAAVQRYKGLGEMNPDQLWDTTMDPAKRTMKQVSIADAAEASKTFDILMGDEVAPRKLFIQTHARAVQNLDV